MTSAPYQAQGVPILAPSPTLHNGAFFGGAAFDTTPAMGLPVTRNMGGSSGDGVCNRTPNREENTLSGGSEIAIRAEVDNSDQAVAGGRTIWEASLTFSTTTLVNLGTRFMSLDRPLFRTIDGLCCSRPNFPAEPAARSPTGPALHFPPPRTASTKTISDQNCSRNPGSNSDRRKT